MSAVWSSCSLQLLPSVRRGWGGVGREAGNEFVAAKSVAAVRFGNLWRNECSWKLGKFGKQL